MAETDPEHWFLPSRPYTVGNEVVALVDGADYMKHLYDRFLQMRAGDSLYFTAWRASPAQKLRPDISSSDVRSVFLSLIKRGVVIRILAWYPPGSALFSSPVLNYPPVIQHQKDNTFFIQDTKNAAKRYQTGGDAFLDERLPSRVASHHQKSIVLKSEGDYWAYVGGIDLSLDRWDTREHASPGQRQRELLAGWHDVHCVIRGSAVKEVWQNFKDRWNDSAVPVRWPGPDSGRRPDQIRFDLSVPPASKGSINVQTLRTLACGGVYGFKPHGDQTAREGINRAINQAKYFVYLEDQYFWPCTTIDCLARAIRERGVHLFLVLAKEFDAPEPFASAHYEMRADALNAVRNAGPNKVVCCHLEQRTSKTQIYVHSKFMIIDDRFVAIGSTNVGLRSHTTDSELHVSMVDSDVVNDGLMSGSTVRVNRFAKELRLRVWNEHLNVSENELKDPIASKSRWPQKGGAPASHKVHHAVYHSGDRPRKPTTLMDWYRVLKMLRELLKLPQPWPNFNQKEGILIDEVAGVLEKLDEGVLTSGLTDLALGPVWWAPKIGLKYKLMELLKNKIMNVETRCE